MHYFSRIIWLPIGICRCRSSFPSTLDLDCWWKDVSFPIQTLSVRSSVAKIHFFEFQKLFVRVFNPRTLLKFISSFLPSLVILSSSFFTLLFLLWEIVSVASLIMLSVDCGYFWTCFITALPFFKPRLLPKLKVVSLVPSFATISLFIWRSRLGFHIVLFFFLGT